MKPLPAKPASTLSPAAADPPTPPPRRWAPLARKAVLLGSMLGLSALAMLATQPVASAPLRIAAPASQAATAAAPDADRERAVRAAWLSAPMRFEPNLGQAAEPLQYLARGPGYQLGLDARGAVLTLHGHAEDGRRARLAMRLAGADTKAAITAEQPQSSVSHYLIGADASRWHRNVPNFGAVRYAAVYPGIDWVFYGNPQQLEHDFVVAPQADPGRIRMKLEGARTLAVNADGGLEITVGEQRLVQHRPVSYQLVDGQRVPVDSRYVLDEKRQEVAFAVGDYDRTRPLTIDPVLVYSTFFGGSSNDTITSVSVASDGSGLTLIGGETYSTDLPTRSAAYPVHGSDNGNSDAFIAEFNASGALLFSTYLGGNNQDSASAVVLRSGGSIGVVGLTVSTDIPQVGSLPRGGGADAFVMSLASNGAFFNFSTYLGGSGLDRATAVAAIPNTQKLVVAGKTTSTNFPLYSASQTRLAGSNGASDGFVTEFDIGGQVVFSTYLGGSDTDEIYTIATDADRNIYVGGSTLSNDFPTRNPLQPTRQGLWEGFITKFAQESATRLFSTYLGGDGSEFLNGIAVDDSQAITVVGSTSSAAFPVVNAYQNRLRGDQSGFVSRIASSGNALLWSTYLGASKVTSLAAVTLDPLGNCYVTGTTGAPDFPIVNSSRMTPAGGTGDDVVVAKFSPSGAMRLSTVVGGSTGDGGYGIAYDAASDSVVVGGYTTSSNIPIVNAAFPYITYGTTGYAQDGILFRLAPVTSTLQFGLTQFSVAESGRRAYVSVERVDSSEGPVSVRYTTQDGRALAGTHYTATSGILSWADGDTGAKTISIPIIDNATPNEDRDLSIVLSDPGLHARIGSPSSATLVITDDDTPPASNAGIAFSSASYAVSEAGGQATITVQRTGSVAAGASVTVATANGTATTPGDYGAASQTLSWAAGDSGVRTLTIPIIDNFVETGDKTVNLALSAPSGATLASPSTAVLTIVDDEAGLPGRIQLSGTQFNVAENAGSASVTLTRSGGSSGQACVLAATANGTAAAGTDYTATSNTVCFADNEMGSKSLIVPIINNTVVDGTRSFAVNLSNPSGGGLGAPASAAVSIADDDVAAAPGTLQFTAASYSVTEGGVGKVFVSRTGGTSGAVSVHYTTQDGTALQPGDYTRKTGTLSWADGDAANKSISIATVDDATAEGNETVRVIFDTAPTGGATVGAQSTTTLTIVDNDAPAAAASESKIAFGAPEYRVVQGMPVATVTVNRSGSSSGAVTAQLQRPADPLTRRSEPVLDTIRFEDGDASTQTVDIPLAGYNLLPGTQTVPLALVNASGASLGDGPTESTLIVQDGRVSAQPASVGAGTGSSGGGALSPLALLGLLIAWRRRRLH